MILSLFRKVFKFTSVFLLLVIGITFCVSNREAVKLTFYPLPFEVSVPLFFFTMLVLIVGILVGWFYSHLNIIRLRLQSRGLNKRIAALENELKAINAEKLIQQPVASLSKQ